MEVPGTVKTIKRNTCAILIAISILANAGTASASIRDILKDGAIIIGGGAVVAALSKQIDDFINTITFNRGAKFDGFTKVVPILSLGNGTRIGAAQIGANSQDAMERTQAVAQLEVGFQGIGVRILIPIDSLNPTQQFKRVQGVGVTAIIDVKI